MNALDICYEKSKEGLGKVAPPVSKMAEDYLKKNESLEKAAKSMLNHQVVKCTTSGFITGFGGLLTLPITVPANIGSVLYVQMRMIACTAYMSGMDLDSDQVQTFVYACLAGISVNTIVKKFGVQFGKKVTYKGIQKIPGKLLVSINQKVGFRLLTKFGEKGLINLGKAIPVVGAVINGGFDYTETKIIAGRAYKMFIEGSTKPEDGFLEEIIIDMDEIPEDSDNSTASDD